eukprot:g24123.t1
MPPQAEMKVSKAGVCYFHDLINDYYTIEHPLTQRYLKVLERQRLDLLCLRTKPSVNGLLFSQPDMLFNKQFRNLQIPCQSCGVMQSTLKCNQCLMSFCHGERRGADRTALPLAPAMERRRDPEDGGAYTYDEILAHYTAEGYKKKEVNAYWEQECTPVKGKKVNAEPKAKAKAKAEPKAKAKAKAKAEPKAKAKAKAKAEPKAKAKAKAEPKVKAKAKASPALRGSVKAESEGAAVLASPGRLPRARAVMHAMKRRELDALLHFFQRNFWAAQEGTFHTWSELPKGGQLVESVGYYSNELAFWGGDLPSLTGKLDYINDLGVDVMYLQPVTKSFSNHKYDTTDYKDLDAQYGTDEDFKTLVDALHEKGMKLVLDFVFNHCGKRSNLVQEALKDKESPNRKFFFMGDEYQPHGYKVWGCAPSLVELALESKEGPCCGPWAEWVADSRSHRGSSTARVTFVATWQDSALATWLRRGADGARLDVASEIGLDLLSSITRAAHRHKKGSLVVGEVWAYSPHWTSCMDAVLSLHLGVLIYGLAEGTLPGPSAAQSLARMVADSSIEEVLKCWIVVSNHDMPRLAHRLPDLKARKFAQALQFTWPGCPLIYYGDELGLEGGTTDRVSEVVIVLANPLATPVKEMVVVPVPAILGHTLFKDVMDGEETRLLGSTLTVEVKPKTVRIFTMVNEVGNPSGDQYKRTWGHWASFASDYFCFKCFEDMHRRGNRLQHKSMLVSVSDGDVIEPQKRCEECEDRPAAFACDYCLDNYCVQCFWKCHFNGHRRQHTASKVAVECFTMLHAKGNRMLHLFMDAMASRQVAPRVGVEEHMRRARPRVLWALSQLQGWVKGIEARRNFKKRKDVVLMIQRRWRGVLTRRRLLGMLHMHKWRRRQVNNYFLPKTAAERRAVKQKTTAMLSAKDGRRDRVWWHVTPDGPGQDVTTRAANQSLRELRSTILNTATADPLEDAQMTRDQMEALPGATEVPGAAGFSHTMPSGVSPYTSYEQSSRFNGALTDPSFGQQAQDLSKKDRATSGAMATQPLMSAASAASAAVALDKEGYRELIRRGDQEQMAARSDGSCGDCCASSSSGPDAAQALRPGSTAPTVELPMDGRNWVAQAIAGPLALAHPPWWRRWSGGGGPAQLVLLSPDGGRGLVISSSCLAWDRRGWSIATQLGAGLSALQQPEVYEALRGDPTQLARLATAAGAVATEMQIPTAPPEEEVRPDEEHELAIQWSGRASQRRFDLLVVASIVVWPGFSRARPGRSVEHGSQDDRTYLQTLADGLRGRNSWSSMNRVEKAAYAGGILAAAGWGFMLGYTEERHRASHVLVLDVLPAEHQLAQAMELVRARLSDWTPSAIDAVCFAPEASGLKLLALSRQNGSVELWDTETWHCRLSSCPTSPPEGRAAVALLWAPDLASAEGWRLLSAGLQQEIETMAILETTTSGAGAIWALALEGQTMAAACEDGTLRLFSLAEGRGSVVHVRRLAVGQKRLLSVGSCEGFLYTGGSESRVSKWSLATGVCEGSMCVEEAGKEQTLVWKVVPLPDEMLAAGDSLGFMYIFDTVACVALQRFAQHQADVLALCAEGDLLVSGSMDCRLCHFHRQRGSQERYAFTEVKTQFPRCHSHDIRAIAIDPTKDPDHWTYVSGGVAGCLVVQRVFRKLGQEDRTARRKAQPRECSAFSSFLQKADVAQQRRLVLCQMEQKLELWHLKEPTSQLLQEESRTPKTPPATQAMEDESWTPSKPQLLISLSLKAQAATATPGLCSSALSPEGVRVAASDAGGTRLFEIDVKELQVRRVKALPTELAQSTMRCMHFSEDRLICARWEGGIRSPQEHKAPVTLLASAPGWLISADVAGGVKVFDLKTLKLHCSVPGQDMATAIAVVQKPSPRAVVVTATHQLKVFDLESQSLLHEHEIPRKFLAHHARVCGVVSFDQRPEPTLFARRWERALEKLMLWGHGFVLAVTLEQAKESGPVWRAWPESHVLTLSPVNADVWGTYTAAAQREEHGAVEGTEPMVALAVEVTPESVKQRLPPPFERKKFNKRKRQRPFGFQVWAPWTVEKALQAEDGQLETCASRQAWAKQQLAQLIGGAGASESACEWPGIERLGRQMDSAPWARDGLS